MATIKPFRALRPQPELAAGVACPPYDVVDTDEARNIIRSNPDSFIRVIRPEADFDRPVEAMSPEAYGRARGNLDDLVTQGRIRKDPYEGLYLYRQESGDHVQTGLVTCLPVEDYRQGRIKKHEHTRHDKVEDRSNHIDTLEAQAGPVFMTYRARPAIDALVSAASAGEPEIRFRSGDGVVHSVWPIADRGAVDVLVDAFREVEAIYIADGHHRAEAASNVVDRRRGAGRGAGPWDRFLSVLFPSDQVRILPYNRVMRDLGGVSAEALLRRAQVPFEVSPLDAAEMDAEPKGIRLYLEGRWYELVPRPVTFDPKDPVARLDADILQFAILAPILRVEDPRRDERLKFIGGDKGAADLEALVNGGRFKCAFSLRPVKVEEIMAVADAGGTMPPKSTWFDPKLRSGLFVHSLRT